MSKLSEYINLLPKAIPNALQIIEAVNNEVKLKFDTLPEDQKEEITRRRIICISCPFNSKRATNSKEYKELTGINCHTKRDDTHCSFCGCGINIRTSALNKECGIETWNKENPNKKLDLKWDIYEK